MAIEFDKDEIRLRKISSLDGSPKYNNLTEKKKGWSQNKKEIIIPKYGQAPPYTSNTIKRFFARVGYFSAIARQRFSNRDYPVIAIIVVNNHCNWDCVYCFGDYPNRREVDYTTDEIKYLVDELYSMGVRYLNLHGGETLLRDDIGELSNYIKNKGIYLCIITNGSFFPKKLDQVRNADNVTISLDGTRENNDINRGQGAFDMALEAVEHLRSANIPVRVSATLTRHSMGDVEFLAKLAYEKNFQLYFSILFKPLKKALDCQMSNEEIKKTIKEIQRYKSMGYPIFTNEPVLEAAYEWPFDYNEKHHVRGDEIPESYKPHHIKCYYGRTKFTVEADGYVYPCFLTTDGSFKPVNWRELGVRAAVEHVQKTNTCQACPAMSQNDHSLLLGFNLAQVKNLAVNQLKEVFGLRDKLKPRD